MHEFGIGEELAKAVLAELDRLPAPKRLLGARVVIGVLRQVIPDHLTFAYEIFLKDTPAAGSTLEIAPVPVVVVCEQCGWQGEIEEMIFLCGACGSTQLRMVTGMELYLDRLEVEYDERNGD